MTKVIRNPKKVAKVDKVSDLIQQIDKIFRSCEEIREELDRLGEKIVKAELDIVKKKVSQAGRNFDLIIEAVLAQDIFEQKLYIKLTRTQAIISKIAHKVNTRKYNLKEKDLEKMNKQIKEDGDKFLEKSKKYEKQSENLEKETKTIKENVLTITSLIFAAFTFIQINFIAFQHTDQYIIWDRIILFGMVNIFCILGIYSIFSMIRVIMNDTNYCKELKIKLSIPIILLVFSVFLAGWRKYVIELDPLYKNRIVYYKELIKKLDENNNKLVRNLEELKFEIKTTSELLISKQIELEEVKKQIKEEKMNFTDFMIKEKEKIKKEFIGEIVNKNLLVEKNDNKKI